MGGEVVLSGYKHTHTHIHPPRD